MDKTRVLIFVLTLLLLEGACLFYFNLVPIETGPISYARTDAHQVVDFTPSFDIQVGENGELWIDEDPVTAEKLNKIYPRVFSQYGIDFSVNLHIDKDAKMREVKPIFDAILKAGGYRVRLVAKRRNSSNCYFMQEINPDNFKSKHVFELSPEKIKLNGKVVTSDDIENLDLHGMLRDAALYCDENVTYQRLVDFLSLTRCRQLQIGPAPSAEPARVNR